MSSHAARMLLTSRHEDEHLHRTIVRVGAACAWLVTVVFFAAGLISGSQSVWLQAVSPLLVAVLMTAQIALDREDGGVALLGSGLVGAIWYTLFGDPATAIAAGLTLVVVSALWMFFVRRRRLIVAGVLTVALFGLPFLWPLSFEEKITFAPIMAMSFVLTHLVLSTIQSAAADLNTRYQVLFETSPMAVLEEDWSEAVDYVRSEYTGKPRMLRQFLLAYPAVVSRAVSRARILRANDAAFALLDVEPERLIGYRSPRVVTEETLDAFVDALVSLYEGVPGWDAEVSVPGRDGSKRWLHARSMQAPIGTPGSSIVVAIVDVTHMKERNEAMSSMVRAKDEFIASVSHELRTPLTAVIGITSELADDDALSAEERKELTKLVAGQAAEMANIVDDLLVAARADMGTVTIDMTEVDLISELEAAVEGLGIDIELPEQTLPAVMADPKRVRQILRNLLTNASRYGGPTRRVVVGKVRHSAWLEVRDDGAGIPPDQAARIFEPYVTGNSGVEGSVGLGLAVARQLAELMGGSLQYERNAAESVFRLQLPLSERKPALASYSDRR